jgi:hypothetical protein
MNPIELMNKFNSKTLEDSIFKPCDENRPELMDEKIKSKVEDSKFSNIKSDFPLKNKINTKIVYFSNLKALIFKSYIRVKRNPLSVLIYYLSPVIEITALKFCFGQKPYQ